MNNQINENSFIIGVVCFIILIVGFIFSIFLIVNEHFRQKRIERIQINNELKTIDLLVAISLSVLREVSKRKPE